MGDRSLPYISRWNALSVRGHSHEGRRGGRECQAEIQLIRKLLPSDIPSHPNNRCTRQVAQPLPHEHRSFPTFTYHAPTSTDFAALSPQPTRSVTLKCCSHPNTHSPRLQSALRIQRETTPLLVCSQVLEEKAGQQAELLPADDLLWTES